MAKTFPKLPWLMLACLIVPIVDSGIGVARAYFRINREFGMIVAQVEQMKVTIGRRAEERPTLRGTSEPGDAWEDYVKAAEVIRKSPERRELCSMINNFYYGRPADGGDVPITPQEMASVFQKLHPALDHLAQGARRTRVCDRARIAKGFSPSLPGGEWPDTQDLPRLAVGRARVFADEGRLREATELLLDGVQYGRDLGAHSSSTFDTVGRSILCDAMKELGRLMGRPAMGPEEALAVETAIATLEGILPDRSSRMLDGLACFGTGIISEERDDTCHYSTSTGTRSRYEAKWMYSSKLRSVDSFHRVEHWIDRSMAAARHPWLDACKVHRDIREEMSAADDPLIQDCGAVSWIGTVDWYYRTTLARARVLRVAAHWRRTGEVLALEDPYGDWIKVVETPEKITFSSLGAQAGNPPVRTGFSDSNMALTCRKGAAIAVK